MPQAELSLEPWASEGQEWAAGAAVSHLPAGCSSRAASLPEARLCWLCQAVYLEHLAVPRFLVSPCMGSVSVPGSSRVCPDDCSSVRVCHTAWALGSLVAHSVPVRPVAVTQCPFSSCRALGLCFHRPPPVRVLCHHLHHVSLFSFPPNVCLGVGTVWVLCAAGCSPCDPSWRALRRPAGLGGAVTLPVQHEPVEPVHGLGPGCCEGRCCQGLSRQSMRCES